MNNQRTIRFFPLPVVWLGIATWLILTFAACHADIVANDYKLPVIVFGIAITALSMAFVVGWASLLLALVVNWSASGRRSMFRATLLECSAFFGFITAIAVLAIFYLDT